MSRALLASWRLPALAPGPCAERRDPPSGRADQFVGGLLAAWARRAARLRLLPARRFAARVMAREAELAAADEAELQCRVARLRRALAVTGLEDQNAVEAFALIREVCFRRLGKRHYAVQLMGGFTMLHGGLAEMMTGEGKTLAALLPAASVALAGLPVHVITVNAYLARRDAEQLAPVYDFFGLRVGLVQPGQEAPERARAYACEVCYCVNKDLVFDYLRDRLADPRRRSGARVEMERWLGAAARPAPLLRGLYYAIVDEADSVLIDEARTPLIISAADPDSAGRALYAEALACAASLVAGRHYRLDLQARSVELLAGGHAAVAEFARGREGLWQVLRAREELVEQGLSALHLFARDRHYLLADGKVKIVDEYTGRLMADRSWEQGLHQMIEVKEGLMLTPRRATIARITYQRYFRRYLRLAGMSGTLTEVAPELRRVYGLDVLRIPPNRPLQRRDQGRTMFAASAARWDAVLAAARAMSAAGRAVLIGTRSVAASESLAAQLRAAGLDPQVLNARDDAGEAALIAAAGQAGRITVATDMAGRGTDILLTPQVRAAGGLHVILTEHHDSARIDRQLYGRAGRQGDPGSCEALVSIEDELFAARAARLAAWLGAHPPAGGVLPARLARLLAGVAQAAAESHHARLRRHAVALDESLAQALAFAGRGE